MAGPLPVMVHVARTGKTVGRRQAPDALGAGCRGLLRAYAPPDDRSPPALLGLLGEAGSYVNAGLTERLLFMTLSLDATLLQWENDAYIPILSASS